MRIRGRVAAGDEADAPLGGGGGGGGGVDPGGDGGEVPDSLEALTLTANFCPLEQCVEMVQMK